MRLNKKKNEKKNRDEKYKVTIKLELLLIAKLEVVFKIDKWNDSMENFFLQKFLFKHSSNFELCSNTLKQCWSQSSFRTHSFSSD